MAAPTSVRVEATSLDSTIVRWTYGGTHSIGVYRSTDAAAYTLIDTVADTTTSYTDTGLAAGTRYWYKLSDDEGSTYSSVVNVTTHTCPSEAGEAGGVALPRFDGEEQESDKLNDLAAKIEDIFGDRILSFGECLVCITNGAIVIDCSSGCTHFTVLADADINSITINLCGNTSGEIDFIVPPGVITEICGWPQGTGFSGDECSDAPIDGGDNGRTVTVPFGPGPNSNPPPGSGGGPRPGDKPPCKDCPPKVIPPGPESKNGYGGGRSGGDCTCLSGSLGQLTIKCCTDDCSLDCDGAKSLKLRVCGGKGPYTWTNTGSLVLSGTTGTVITVTPPTNTNSAVAGTAYQLVGKCVGNAAGGCACAAPSSHYVQYGCADQEISCGSTGACADPASVPELCSSVSGGGCSMCPSGTLRAGEDHWCNCTVPDCSGDCCIETRAGGQMKDCRSAGMITDGCVPCGLEDGSTVTVTDNAGEAVSITVRT